MLKTKRRSNSRTKRRSNSRTKRRSRSRTKRKYHFGYPFVIENIDQRDDIRRQRRLDNFWSYALTAISLFAVVFFSLTFSPDVNAIMTPKPIIKELTDITHISGLISIDNIAITHKGFTQTIRLLGDSHFNMALCNKDHTKAVMASDYIFSVFNDYIKRDAKLNFYIEYPVIKTFYELIEMGVSYSPDVEHGKVKNLLLPCLKASTFEGNIISQAFLNVKCSLTYGNSNIKPIPTDIRKEELNKLLYMLYVPNYEQKLDKIDIMSKFLTNPFVDKENMFYEEIQSKLNSIKEERLRIFLIENMNLLYEKNLKHINTVWNKISDTELNSPEKTKEKTRLIRIIFSRLALHMDSFTIASLLSTFDQTPPPDALIYAGAMHIGTYRDILLKLNTLDDFSVKSSFKGIKFPEYNTIADYDEIVVDNFGKTLDQCVKL